MTAAYTLNPSIVRNPSRLHSEARPPARLQS
jgi:hypothetical protein